jgi:hypothetical protein
MSARRRPAPAEQPSNALVRGSQGAFSDYLIMVDGRCRHRWNGRPFAVFTPMVTGCTHWATRRPMKGHGLPLGASPQQS